MVRCECRPWFAGRNCQINLKLLLIVGCVSVILMIVIACGVSCFCCRDRNAAKDNIPCEYHEKLMEKEIEMELLPFFCKNCTSFFSYELLNDFLQFFAAPYGTTMSRMPTNMGRQQGFMMDPHAGKLKVVPFLRPFSKS